MSEDTMTVDESPQSITDVNKERHRRLSYLAIVLWYVISYVLLITFTGGPIVCSKVPGIYWLATHPWPAMVAAFAPPIVVIILLRCIPGFFVDKTADYLQIIFFFAVLFLILQFVLLTGLTLIKQYRHVQTLRHDNHTYYLADSIPLTSMTMRQHACWQRATDPDCIEADFTHEYFVYQCGWLGVVCHRIGYKALDEQVWRSHGKLVVDVGGHVVLEVEGRRGEMYPDG